MMRKKLLFLAALGLFQTLGVGQNALAHTDALRSDLKQLIVGDELECRLDGHLGAAESGAAHHPSRMHACWSAASSCDVYSHVLAARVLADDHAFVYHRAGADEQRAAILCVEQAVADSLAGLKRDQRTGGALLDIALGTADSR